MKYVKRCSLSCWQYVVLAVPAFKEQIKCVQKLEISVPRDWAVVAIGEIDDETASLFDKKSSKASVGRDLSITEERFPVEEPRCGVESIRQELGVVRRARCVKLWVSYCSGRSNTKFEPGTLVFEGVAS